MRVMRKLIFLPGALGAAAFWHPVGARLPAEWQKVYLAWPGLGAQRPDPDVRGFDDLVRRVEAELTEPCKALCSLRRPVASTSPGSAEPTGEPVTERSTPRRLGGSRTTAPTTQLTSRR
jgi:hypothetical protein